MKTSSAKDRVAEQYKGDNGLKYHARQHSSNPFVQQVVARERAKKFQPFINHKDRVVEFGVGTGLNMLLLKCSYRIGYDINEAGREVCERSGIRYVTNLKHLADETFDVVLCHHVLEHVPDPFNTLEILRSLLKPGGRLIICVPFETHSSYRNYRPNDPNQHLFSWSALTLGNLVKVTGFEINICRVNPFGYEQRLAPLARLGTPVYRLGLRTIRLLRRADELLLVATTEHPGTL